MGVLDQLHVLKVVSALALPRGALSAGGGLTEHAPVAVSPRLQLLRTYKLCAPAIAQLVEQYVYQPG